MRSLMINSLGEMLNGLYIIIKLTFAVIKYLSRILTCNEMSASFYSCDEVSAISYFVIHTVLRVCQS